MGKQKIKKTRRNKEIYSGYLEAKKGPNGSIETFLSKMEKKHELTRVQLYNIINYMKYDKSVDVVNVA